MKSLAESMGKHDKQKLHSPKTKIEVPEMFHHKWNAPETTLDLIREFHLESYDRMREAVDCPLEIKNGKKTL